MVVRRKSLYRKGLRRAGPGRFAINIIIAYTYVKSINTERKSFLLKTLCSVCRYGIIEVTYHYVISYIKMGNIDKMVKLQSVSREALRSSYCNTVSVERKIMNYTQGSLVKWENQNKEEIVWMITSEGNGVVIHSTGLVRVGTIENIESYDVTPFVGTVHIESKAN